MAKRKRSEPAKWFRVRNEYRCTADVVVQAVDSRDALRVALGLPDEPNHDDSLYDSEVIEESDQPIEL